MVNRVLIYDSNTSGHLAEYIEYLNDYFNIHSDFKKTYYECLINKNILNSLEPNIMLSLKKNKNLKINAIDSYWQNKFDDSSNQLIKTLIEKKFLETYCIKNKIDKIIFLQIDAYQLIIGLWRFSSRFKNIIIFGILFQPYIQLSNNKTLLELIKTIRKQIQINFMLLNKSVKKVFIFNDQNSVDKLNKKRHTKTTFEYLPDPIKRRRFKKIDIKTKYTIDNSKKILLFIGGVQKRKNIISIIKALSFLNPYNKNKICLMILGKCNDKNLLDEINTEISHNSETQIVFVNQFVSTDEFESAIFNSFIVFTIYSDFYCSSGIIGNVIKHGKYLIASNLGVIGNITKENKLGKTVNPNSIIEIKSAIEECLNNEKLDNIHEIDKFVLSHSHTKFVEKLLS